MSAAPGTIEQLARDVARTPDADTALRALSTLRRELTMAEPELVGRALQDGASWSQIARALGISKQAAHRKYRHLKIDFEELAGAGALPLSANARRSLGYARQEASSLGHPVIGTEHLLLGILRCHESRVVGLLEELGVHYDAARARTQPTMPGASLQSPGDAPAGRPDQGVSPHARRILEGAVREARRRHDHAVGVEHLLAALLADSRNGAVQTLEAMRIPPAHVRRELERRWS
jgi:Clp amino terminal domain, pathogenicity island component